MFHIRYPAGRHTASWQAAVAALCGCRGVTEFNDVGLKLARMALRGQTELYSVVVLHKDRQLEH